MRTTRQSPKETRTKGAKGNTWQNISNDPDIRKSAKFLKVTALRVITATLAFCMIATGACVIVLVINRIFDVLNARKFILPRWVHESESLSVSAVLIILMLLATIIALKDMWRAGIQEGTEEKTEEKHKP